MFKKNDNNIILRNINHRDLVIRYLLLVIGCLIAALAFNMFFLKYNIVCFGVSGISIITDKVFKIDPSLFILIISIILLIISALTLGFEKTKNSIIGSLIFPLCVTLTKPFVDLIPINTNDILLIAIFGGFLSGLGYGLIFKTGFTTGGTDILNQIVSKFFKISIGKAMLLVDGMIVLAGGFVFGIEMIMYGAIVLYIISMMSDKVILGISEGKAFYIITNKEKEVKNYLINIALVGVTVIDAKGGFSNLNQKVLMCVIPTKMYFLVKEGINEIDADAFFVVTDAYEVTHMKHKKKKNNA